MKNCNPMYLFLSLLEGMLSGGYFYLARRDKEPLDLATGIVFLATSVFHGLLGLRGEDADLSLLEDSDDD